MFTFPKQNSYSFTMFLKLKKVVPHILVILGFIVVALAYFHPVLSGKQIFQSDIKHYIGMAQQQKDFKAATGQETYWTNSAFGGMPTYQLGARYPHNYIKKIDSVLRFLPRPADYLFLYFIGFYILFLALKVDYKIGALGALAFGFSTYLIIIIGVGHNSKAHAIAYMPMVLGGVLLAFQKRYILGFLVTALAMALEIGANHFQMTYYLMLLVIVLGIVYLVDAYKKKELPHFFKTVGILIAAVVLSVGLNATNIMATQEYVKESTRGKSELTINPDGSEKVASSGLNKEYITEYSYGRLETLNLFIPRFMGGGTYEDVGRTSSTYDAYRKMGASPGQALDAVKQTPTYWGNQPIVEAPAYVGAVILFLFVFALFLVKGRLKWWLVGGVLLSLLLSWGKNLSFLTDFFIEVVPLYNKFRAVSSIQVILELCIPILAMFGLVRLFNDFEKDDEKLKALKHATLITAGLALVLLVGRSMFDFVGLRDSMWLQNYGLDFIDAVKEDRKTFYTQDTIRTLALVLLSTGAIYMFLKKKLSENILVVALGALILFDLVGVDLRYVNPSDNEQFRPGREINVPYVATAVDNEILKDKSHYRVFDISSNSGQSPAKAAYFHNSLTGYHAAKLGRYDELLEFHVYRNNINVLNMLNTKYIIADDERGNAFPYINDDANGNAWFIEKLEHVNSANEEILRLDSLDTKRVAIYSSIKPKGIVHKKVPNAGLSTFKVDSLASIKLTEAKPNYLKYQSSNPNEGFAVFSEIYYKDGWNAYIDGDLKPHNRVDYVLRGMSVPKGQHTIEFKFEPEVVKTGSSIALGSSILLGLLILGGLFFEFKKK